MTQSGPVGERERVACVDVLRGVAVMGILAMNIVAFAQPFAAYMNPMAEGLEPYAGRWTPANAVSWWVAYVLFDTKMMTIFSMLFGAGLVLMHTRSEAAGRRGLAGLYYSRLFWLLVIGVAHAYLLWFGDILVLYALCGLVLYPMRRMRARTLAVIGIVLLLVPLPINLAMGLGLKEMRATAQSAEAAKAEGKPLSAEQERALKQWSETRGEIAPTPEDLKKDIEQMRGGYGTVFVHNAEAALAMQTFFTVIWGMWRAGGLMLVGMALMKSGVFSGERSAAFYKRLAIVGYGLGLPIVVYGGMRLVGNRFEPIRAFMIDYQFNYIGSVMVALGHVAAVMLICRGAVSAGARAAVERVGAVGRMALSNYLSQTIICTTVFFGWGLGYFGTFERWQQWLVVLGVWVLQLLWSEWWLRRFQFGPAEWLWRSLTYRRAQPVSRTAATAGAPA